MRSRKFARVLAGLSCVSLFGGLYFPIAALLDEGPSVMVYGLGLVSFPAWVLGTLSGGLASYLASRTQAVAPSFRRFSWVCAALNLTALIVGWLWNPPGVS
jgi:hypothetical protein